jgi:hypothetical protein
VLRSWSRGAGIKEKKRKEKKRKEKKKSKHQLLPEKKKGVLGTIRFKYRSFECFSGLNLGNLGMWRSVFSRMIVNARLKMVSVKLNLLQLENDKIIKIKIQKC